MKKFILLAVLAFAALASPAAASAGCLAEGGPVNVASTSPSVSTFGRANCTTGNGSHYQLRLYLQSNYGGTYHIVGPASSRDIYSPGSNTSFRLDKVLDCGYFEAAATATRSKAVVENVVTGSIDVDYGLASSLPSNCY